MPRPLDFSRFSGARGSATSSGSKPSPWSRTTMASSDGWSAGEAVNSTLTRLDSSPLLPCFMALATDSRTAMLIQCSVSSSKPDHARHVAADDLHEVEHVEGAADVQPDGMAGECHAAPRRATRCPWHAASIRGAAQHCRIRRALAIVVAHDRRPRDPGAARAGPPRRPRRCPPTSRFPTATHCWPRWPTASRPSTATPPAPTACRPWPASKRSASRWRGTPGADGLAVRITGRPHGVSSAAAGDVDCGNSGTTMRLLAGTARRRSRSPATLIGDASLSRRPMRRVMAPLTAMGARIDAAEGGRPPLAITGGPPRPASPTRPRCRARRSRARCCWPDCAPPARPRWSWSRQPTRDHTERALAAFGVRGRPLGAGPHRRAPAGRRLAGGLRAARARRSRRPRRSSAVAAAGLAGSAIDIDDVGLNPTRTALFDVLRRAGAAVTDHRRPARGTASRSGRVHVATGTRRRRRHHARPRCRCSSTSCRRWRRWPPSAARSRCAAPASCA